MDYTEGKGLSARLQGKQRENEPAIKAHAAGRASLFWAILKGRFGRLVFINLLMVITALPVIGLAAYRYVLLTTGQVVGPYGAGLGVGYPMIPQGALMGIWENNILNSDIFIFALMIPASMIFAVGLSGGMYLCRNLVRTEGIYFFSDFKRGIKQNFLPVFTGTLLFTLILFLARTVGDVADWQIAMGESKGLFITSKVIGYVIMSFILLVALWMISLGIEYKLKPLSLIRNAIVLTVGTFPQTVLFAAVAIAPIFLIMFTSGFLFVIGFAFYIFIGFSYFLLVWSCYSSWVLDKFLMQEQTEETRKPTAKQPAQQAPLTEEERLRMLSAYGKSRVIGRPVAPIEEGAEPFELPQNFSRADLKRQSESRAALKAESDSFAQARINEPEYADYNKLFEERDKALEAGKGKKKAPKRPPKMLNR